MPPDLAPAEPFAIVVMGVSGCGKTTVGRLLAETLRCPFLEGDDYHAPEAVAKMRGGYPLSDDDRWPWLERLGVATARALGEYGVAVTACSALRKCYRDRLRSTIGARVRFVLLENHREQLLTQLGQRAGHFMPASLLDSQLATLERPLADEDAITCVTDEPPESLCDRILAELRLER